MTITIEYLREHNACSWDCVTFLKTFGDSAELTQANCIKAASAGLDLEWLAYNLFSGEGILGYRNKQRDSEQLLKDEVSYAADVFKDSDFLRYKMQFHISRIRDEIKRHQAGYEIDVAKAFRDTAKKELHLE
jgi:hypothetical protein